LHSSSVQGLIQMAQSKTVGISHPGPRLYHNGAMPQVHK
jgi:hypothetical protein